MSVCVGRGHTALSCLGAYDAVKTALPVQLYQNDPCNPRLWTMSAVLLGLWSQVNDLEHLVSHSPLQGGKVELGRCIDFWFNFWFLVF
jgi:hypothetical protein